MQTLAVKQLLDLLPDKIGEFEGSDYPNPIWTTFLGQKPIDCAELRAAMLENQNAPVTELLEPLLLAAEAVESVQADKDRYFITDHSAQGMVFSGSKWSAGWALVLGDSNAHELIAELKKLDFMVFTDQPGIADTTCIGSRDTSPVYFLQLMVRYGLIWGRIAPGDDHEMGHFLEKDMPGLIIITQDLPPLKYLVTLGLMKLGAPAIVPSTFPFPYGYRVAADSTLEILRSIPVFSNLRKRYYEDEVISLPAPCDMALVNKKLAVAQRFGGTDESFFYVQAGPAEGFGVDAPSAPTGPVGIRVTVGAERFDGETASAVEKVALRAMNTIPGLRAFVKKGRLNLETGEGVQLDPRLLAEAIYFGVRLVYPRLKDMRIEIIADAEKLAKLAPQLRQQQEDRQVQIAAQTETSVAEFAACIECRPFSLVHTCILTPEHPPMCGSRTYASVKAGARFGSDQIPWKRPTEKELPLRTVFPKGKLLDESRGEYEGCNQVYQELTRGQLKRVFLHSVRDFPLTSCGCFQALAFWIPEVKGLGIISRNSPAVTPLGLGWDALANRAGGKQTPGIVGVSNQYMHSPQFLKGDGGMENVVWVDSKLYQDIAGLFKPGQRVATEKDVTTIKELIRFKRIRSADNS